MYVLMILAIVVEVVGVCRASGKEISTIEESSESPPGLSPRVGSDAAPPVFESAPSSWRIVPAPRIGVWKYRTDSKRLWDYVGGKAVELLC